MRAGSGEARAGFVVEGGESAREKGETETKGYEPLELEASFAALRILALLSSSL